ncbi:biopolymer transporter ExbD [uncultured Mucilaginibacter sp.]|uniref:ExbD/TolR family protein n=1 Tax=uncultured Mucilaginibacter sp. TaxID=797541 RepID=UPI0025DECA5D|nr:biopolymer transporter ExbD [uncultured Mucilaginibacter sp.]
MAASKPRRIFPYIDMTAMCDVAFLLLLFVMYIGRPRDITAPIDVKPPVTHRLDISDTDGDYLTVYLKHNKVYLGFDNIPWLRQQALMAMAADRNITFTANQIDKFGRIGNFGDPMLEMSDFIQDYGCFDKERHLKGIPIDNTKNNEFFKWISTSRTIYNKYTGHELRVAIRGEQEEKYSVIKLIIANLQRQNINKFNLITQYVNKKR